MDALSSIFKFIVEKKVLLFAMLTANIAIHFGPVYDSEIFQPWPAPWLQLNFGVGVFCLAILLLNVLTLIGKLLSTIKHVTLRVVSKFQLEELDEEILIEMYNIYPGGVEISRLSHNVSDLKPVHIKSSLTRLVAAGYVKEPFILGPYTISEDGIKKADQLIKLLKQSPKK